MTERDLSFKHIFEPASGAERPPLLLLHGTGGDESDLLPVGRAVAPGVALLSPRGKVLESGMPRFFKRLAEGVFDEDDLARRTIELADFVTEARAAYHLPAPITLGFSNGANIAAALLLMRPGTLAGAALLRAMVPFATPPSADLAGTPVLLVSGSVDPMIPAEKAAHLANALTTAGATVDHRILATGHGLTQEDLVITKDWLSAL